MEKSFDNVNKHSILVTFGQGHWMTMAFGIHWGAQNTFFHITDYHCFGKMQWFTFSPFPSPRDQIWHWQKMGQGQPRVIIWTNLVVLSHLMLHTKFQGNQPSGSGEEDLTQQFWRRRFFKFSTRPFWSWDLDHSTYFQSTSAKMLYMKFDWNWPSGFRGEVVWKSWWMTGHCLYYKLPWSFWLRWAKKDLNKCQILFSLHCKYKD